MIERKDPVEPEGSTEDSWIPEAKWDWDKTEELVTEIPPQSEDKEPKPWYEQGIKMEDPEEISWTGLPEEEL